MSAMTTNLIRKLDRLKLGLAFYRNIMKGKIPLPAQATQELSWGRALAATALHLPAVIEPLPVEPEGEELTAHELLNEAHRAALLLQDAAPAEDQLSGLLHLAAILVDAASRHPELEPHRRLWAGSQAGLLTITKNELERAKAEHEDKPHPPARARVEVRS